MPDTTSSGHERNSDRCSNRLHFNFCLCDNVSVLLVFMCGSLRCRALCSCIFAFVVNSVCVTFGVCMYSLAGLLIVVLLWVLFTSVTYVVIATHAG